MRFHALQLLSHGFLQARVQEWVAISSSSGSSPAWGSNPGLPHCRRLLYQLSHQGKQKKKKRIRPLLKLRFRSIKWRSYTWAFEKEKARLLNCSGDSLWPYCSFGESFSSVPQNGLPGKLLTHQCPCWSIPRLRGLVAVLPPGFTHRVEADPMRFFHPGRKEFSFRAEPTSGLGFV